MKDLRFIPYTLKTNRQINKINSQTQYNAICSQNMDVLIFQNYDYNFQWSRGGNLVEYLLCG